jgi:hypothetical protein
MDLRKPDSLLARVLVAYYGFIQALHLVLLARAAFILWRGGPFPFPAPPPSGGWSDQARYFLLGTGVMDALTIVLVLVFVSAYFLRASWSMWLGIVTLATFNTSAALFGLGTLPSGAWGEHPVAYLGMVVAFLPILLLFVLFNYWMATGRLTDHLE